MNRRFLAMEQEILKRDEKMEKLERLITVTPHTALNQPKPTNHPASLPQRIKEGSTEETPKIQGKS